MGKNATATVSTRLDHLGLISTDVAQLSALYRKLGFDVSDAVELTTDDNGLGQDSAHLMFENSYLELTAPHSNHPDHHLAPYLNRHPGCHSLGMQHGPADAGAAFYDEAGFEAVEIHHSEREAHGGTAKFKRFQLPEEFCDGAFSFAVEHLTPDLVYTGQPQAHANQVTDLISATMVVDDMEASFSQFAKLPGSDLLTFAIGRIVILGEHRLIFVEPSGFNALFADVDLKPSPYCAAMAVRTTSLQAVKDLLSQNGVPYRPWGELAVWVHPDYTGGPVLQFMDANERRDTPRFMPGRPGRPPQPIGEGFGIPAVSYTHLRAHETKANLVCRLLLENNKQNIYPSHIYIIDQTAQTNHS